MLEPLNISITYLYDNKFILNNKELIILILSVVLNIHYEHYVENNSDEDRLHLLVEIINNVIFFIIMLKTSSCASYIEFHITFSL